MTQLFSPKRKDSYRDIHSSFIYNIPKLETNRSPPAGEERTKLWYTYTMEYNSAITRNKLLMHTITWMELKIIMLSKRSQTEKVYIL